MPQIDILIEGYAKEIEGGWLASSTVTLVTAEDKKIIVDPGVNRPRLLEELKKRDLSVSDIDFVFMTHYHLDHILLMALFDEAVVIDNELTYNGDKQIEHDKKIPETDIQILSTPGHDEIHGSLLVESNQGKTVVAGDVFWWADEENQNVNIDDLLSHEDPFVNDEQKLRSSRKMILEIADWVIPGHGRKFEVVR